MEDNEEVYEPDPDEAYDRMRDDFLLCDSEEEAKRLVERYSYSLCKKYLPKQYDKFLEESK